jgi:hypothetical protein
MAQSRDGMDRREFTSKALLAMLAGVTVTMTGCGSPSAPTLAATDSTGAVGTNHGHAVTISAAQLNAGGGVSLNIQGTSSHDHVLELTALEVVRIRAGIQVVKSCGMMRSHQHTITFN